MFDSIEELECRIRDHLNDYRFYSPQSWVPPARADNGRKIHDVIIIGAGQSGLALAYNLKLRGVRRILLLDAEPRDRSGPWSSFARMRQLRTPKSIQGLECGNPLIGFKSWFCSRFSRKEYDAFEFIPLNHWCEYLAWYRRVLDIEVINEAMVTDIARDPCNGAFRLSLDLRTEGKCNDYFYARRVCLATGMTAAGRWAPPEGLFEHLPPSTWCCAWESTDWSRMAGKRVAVIGSGASGFDNAACAIEAGCSGVTVFSRKKIPSGDLYFDLWRGRDDSNVFPEESGTTGADILDPLLEHNSSLGDTARIPLLRALFRHGRSPSNPEYLARVRHLDRMELLEGCAVDEIEYVVSEDRLCIHAGGKRHTFDQVIFATGTQAGLKYRPELSSLADRILTWGDYTDEVLPLSLAQHPKLSPNFQLQSKVADEGGGFEYLYSMADIVHITVGLQSLAHVVTSVAKHIAFSLYREHQEDNLAFIERLIEAPTETG